MPSISKKGFLPITQKVMENGPNFSPTTQKVFRFENNYGASVLHGGTSYSSEKTFELAVIRFDGEGDNEFELVCNTPITSDVIAYAPEEEIQEILNKISSL